MLYITVDRNTVSKRFKAKVSVASDEDFFAIEARATKIDAPYGKGIGLCLLSDDSVTENGVLTFNNEMNVYSFDVESKELDADGEYRIGVYVKNADGVWNDTCSLFTNSRETVVDSQGKVILVQRDSTGTDTCYESVNSGLTIDFFITEVLS